MLLVFGDLFSSLVKIDPFDPRNSILCPLTCYLQASFDWFPNKNSILDILRVGCAVGPITISDLLSNVFEDNSTTIEFIRLTVVSLRCTS